MKKQKTGWKLLLVLTMLVMCVGCGAKKNTSGSVSMYDLRTAMEAADPIRDHIADYSFIALFLHTVQKIAGAFPVIYGEGENIYMDLEKIAEVFCYDSQSLKA